MTKEEIINELDFITNSFIRAGQKGLSHMIYPGGKVELNGVYQTVEDGYYRLNELISKARD